MKKLYLAGFVTFSAFSIPSFASENFPICFEIINSSFKRVYAVAEDHSDPFSMYSSSPRAVTIFEYFPNESYRKLYLEQTFTGLAKFSGGEFESAHGGAIYGFTVGSDSDSLRKVLIEKDNEEWVVRRRASSMGPNTYELAKVDCADVI